MSEDTNDAGERFHRIVMADVHGTATDEEADSLRVDCGTAREWRGLLVRELLNVEAGLAKIKAEVSAKKTRDMREGAAGKQAFFQYAAKREAERVELLQRKAALQERAREAKDLIHVLSRDADPDRTQVSLFQRLDSMQAQLDRIEMLLRR